MYIKRLYDIPEGWEAERDAHGALVNPLPVKAITLKHTGPESMPEQNFSRRMVDAGLQEGWMSMSRGKLTMHTDAEDLEYTILKMPGTYCVHCEAKLDDDPGGASNRAHVTEAHGDAPSPDPAHPAGYRVTNAYECVLREDQHARWSAQAVDAAQQARWQEETMRMADGHATNGTGEPQAQAQRTRGGRSEAEAGAEDAEQG
jgi:hypothetical protein